MQIEVQKRLLKQSAGALKQTIHINSQKFSAGPLLKVVESKVDEQWGESAAAPGLLSQTGLEIITCGTKLTADVSASAYLLMFLIHPSWCPPACTAVPPASVTVCPDD